MNDKIYISYVLEQALKRVEELINQGYQIRMRRGVDAWNQPDGTYVIVYNEAECLKFREEE